ncbi:MAG: sulfatase-like hydrolase/transferase [Verrucomicrobiota bacterium]
MKALAISWGSLTRVGAWARATGWGSFLWLSWMTAPGSLDAAERPNILYIFTDDQSYRTVSAYPRSHRWVKTPHIDRLAENGILFSQAYIGAKCVPSRANALTGRHQFNIGKRTKRYWPEDFRQQGYTTGMIGKWHWNLGTEYHGHGVAWDWSVVWDHNQPGEEKTYYWEQHVNVHGQEAEPLGGYSTDVYTERTIEFIREQAGQAQPWYFWLAYAGVHGPFTPAERHQGRYLGNPEVPESKRPADVFGPRPGKPRHLRDYSRWRDDDGTPAIKGVSLDEHVKLYNEAVLAIDEGVGRITRVLAETGQLENTLIVFTSDQGYAWGHHGLRGKINPYDASLRSPLIVCWPKRFPRGAVCAHPVNGVDLVRTFHELAGVEPGMALDGRDLTPILLEPGRDGAWTEEPMIQTYTVHLYDNPSIEDRIRTRTWESLVYDKNPMPAYLMLHEGRYKYIRYIGEDYIEELYDLQEDPEELRNLALEGPFQTQLADLRGRTLDAFRVKGAAFVDLLPPAKTE